MNRNGITLAGLLVSLALAVATAVALDRLRDHTAARPQATASLWAR